MADATIADLIANTLANAGVERIWGITGDSLNGLNDSLRRLRKIEWMHVRHEEVAAFAAVAQAAVTGRLAVCAGSCGPGNLHLINGLFDCHRNHVPVLAMQLGLPVKVIIHDNGSLGFVAMEMKAGGYLDTGIDLKNPNFAAMAEAMGVLGLRVEDPRNVEGALQQALTHDGPALVDVLTAKQELAILPKIQLEQANGFSLYMLKAIIDGHGDEVIELAQTSLRR